MPKREGVVFRDAHSLRGQVCSCLLQNQEIITYYCTQHPMVQSRLEFLQGFPWSSQLA